MNGEVWSLSVTLSNSCEVRKVRREYYTFSTTHLTKIKTYYWVNELLVYLFTETTLKYPKPIDQILPLIRKS